MRMRWRLILCFWGVTLFGLLTYGSVRVNSMQFNSGSRGQQHHNRYFWWGSVRLDSDPLNKRPTLKPCVEETDTDCDWNPQYIWVDPGLVERALLFTGFPAFLLATAIARGLAHFGVSELLSFVPGMLILTVAWFYMLGWFLDRWRHKRSLHRESVARQPS
jgi:hypothetical protein